VKLSPREPAHLPCPRILRTSLVLILPVLGLSLVCRSCSWPRGSCLPASGEVSPKADNFLRTVALPALPSGCVQRLYETRFFNRSKISFNFIVLPAEPQNRQNIPTAELSKARRAGHGSAAFDIRRS